MNREPDDRSLAGILGLLEHARRSATTAVLAAREAASQAGEWDSATPVLEACRTTHAGTDRAVADLDLITDLVRLHTEDVPIPRQPVDLVQAFRPSLTLRMWLTEARIEWLDGGTDSALVVEANEACLGQVFSAVVDHLATWLPEGGRVGLTLESRGGQGRAVFDTDRCAVAVADWAPRVREPLTTAPLDRPEVEAAALDLARAVRWVHAMDGIFRVEPSGDGVAFNVQLPLAGMGSPPSR